MSEENKTKILGMNRIAYNLERMRDIRKEMLQYDQYEVATQIKLAMNLLNENTNRVNNEPALNMGDGDE